MMSKHLYMNCVYFTKYLFTWNDQRSNIVMTWRRYYSHAKYSVKKLNNNLE